MTVPGGAAGFEGLPGNHSFKKAGPVQTGCMDPNARDLMEEALKKYAAHCAKIRETLPGHRGSVYSFAYWLFRWSGLVGPDGKTISTSQE